MNDKMRSIFAKSSQSVELPEKVLKLSKLVLDLSFQSTYKLSICLSKTRKKEEKIYNSMK